MGLTVENANKFQHPPQALGPAGTCPPSRAAGGGLRGSPTLEIPGDPTLTPCESVGWGPRIPRGRTPVDSLGRGGGCGTICSPPRGGEVVSRQAHNLEVAGSTPAPATRHRKAVRNAGGLSSFRPFPSPGGSRAATGSGGAEQAEAVAARGDLQVPRELRAARQRARRATRPRGFDSRPRYQTQEGRPQRGRPFFNSASSPARAGGEAATGSGGSGREAEGRSGRARGVARERDLGGRRRGAGPLQSRPGRPARYAENRPTPRRGGYAASPGRIAQLVRAPRLHRGGRGFDSLFAHHVLTANGSCPWPSPPPNVGTPASRRSSPGTASTASSWSTIPSTPGGRSARSSAAARFASTAVRARPGTVLRGGERLEIPIMSRAVADVGRRTRTRDKLRKEATRAQRGRGALPGRRPPRGLQAAGRARARRSAPRGRADPASTCSRRTSWPATGWSTGSTGTRAARWPSCGGRAARGDERAASRRSDGSIAKVYEALVEGVPSPAEGEIDLPLTTPGHGGRARGRRARGKPARTRYSTVEAFGEAARLRLELVTGRTHQIRAHLAAIGHPLLVDARYGNRGGWHLRDPRGQLDARLRRTPLHAAELTLPHPRTGEVLTVEAPLPADMKYALEVLRVVRGAGAGRMTTPTRRIRRGAGNQPGQRGVLMFLRRRRRLPQQGRLPWFAFLMRRLLTAMAGLRGRESRQQVIRRVGAST